MGLKVHPCNAIGGGNGLPVPLWLTSEDSVIHWEVLRENNGTNRGYWKFWLQVRILHARSTLNRGIKGTKQLKRLI